MTNVRHWTAESSDNFRYYVAFDFIAELERAMDTKGLLQKDFATLVGVSEGRVSQVFNNPGNLTLRSIVDWTRHLGKKVSVVIYDDHDSEGGLGPVPSDVFRICWEVSGEPRNHGELAAYRLEAIAYGGDTPASRPSPESVLRGPWIEMPREAKGVAA